MAKKWYRKRDPGAIISNVISIFQYKSTFSVKKILSILSDQMIIFWSKSSAKMNERRDLSLLQPFQFRTISIFFYKGFICKVEYVVADISIESVCGYGWVTCDVLCVSHIMFVYVVDAMFFCVCVCVAVCLFFTAIIFTHIWKKVSR